MVFGKRRKEKKEFKLTEPTDEMIEEEEDLPDEEAEEFDEEEIEDLPPIKKKKQVIWTVQNVAIQSEPVIVNRKENKTYTLFQAIAEILNRTE